ncbi:hypothetical protein BGW41_006068 [Actinomortierella wolfii]|nr:hypothetical protein BGW41_006068 [Actinomortierella wolfii]
MPTKPLGASLDNTPVSPVGSKADLEGFGNLELESKGMGNGSHRASADTGEGFVVENWSTTYKSIQIGGNDISFVQDPFATNSGGSNTGSQVMQIYYPKGSYVPSLGPVTGGAQFYAAPFGNNSFQSMMISYEVAFPVGFDYVLGGKLPGIYGGSPHDGCSGGVHSSGSNCLTMRLMWRQGGIGEVYAYIPSDSKFCKDPNVQCNDIYGTSIGRGVLFFPAGRWTRIDMIMQINEPAGKSNGKLTIYLNGNKVIDMDSVPYRSTGMVGFHGLMFSSFFGGSDESYATPVDQYVYFKNFQLAVGPEAQLYEGRGTSSAPSLSPLQSHWIFSLFGYSSPSSLVSGLLWATVVLLISWSF